jgi:hypothetical protein
MRSAHLTILYIQPHTAATTHIAALMRRSVSARLALCVAMAALLPSDAHALRLPSPSPLVVARLASSAACSSFQQQTTAQLYDAAAATAACAPYAVTSSTYSYISAPCTASACIKVAEELAAQLPDCEIDGINEKTQLQDALAACGSSASSYSSSPSSSSSLSSETTAYTDIPVTTRSPSASSSTAGTVGDECTDAQLSNITDVYLEAAATTACSDYMSSASISIYAPCTASACLAVIEELAAAMPNCSYEGDNLKQELEDSLDACGTTSGGSTAYTDIPVTTKSASSLSDSEECSDSELTELSYLYTRAALTDACSAYATITSTYVDITPPCTATACLSELSDVVEQMPNCTYEDVNYKTSLAQGIENCGVSLNGSSTGSTSNNESSSSASTDSAMGGLTTPAWALTISVLALVLAL